MADFVEEGGMAMDSKKKKDRSTNWQDCEIRALLQSVDDMKEGLFAALSMTWTAKKKAQLWQAVTDNVNARGNLKRDVNKVKKRWTNMKARAVAFASQQKRVPTGGGPRETEEWWLEIVLNIIGKENAILTGICQEAGSGQSIVLSDNTNTVDEKGVASTYHSVQESEAGNSCPSLETEHNTTHEYTVIANGDDTIILQPREAVVESTGVLEDVLDVDMESVPSSFLPRASTSTPKRWSNRDCGSDRSVESVAPKRKSNAAAAALVSSCREAPLAASSSQVETITTGSSKTATATETSGVPKTVPSSASAKPVDRLGQLQQKKRRRGDEILQASSQVIKERNSANLIEREMQKIQAEQDYFVERQSV